MAPLEANAWNRVFDRPLYRDHKGRLVLADWEGPAVCEAVGGQCALELDGNDVDLLPGGTATSTRYGVAWSDNGATKLYVANGAPPPGGRQIRARTARGVGWILAGTESIAREPNSVTVDDMPLETFPTPFFRRFEADTEVTAVLLDYEAVLIDSIDIGNLDQRKRLGLQVQNMSAVEELSSSDASGRVVSGYVASHLNAMRWPIDVPKHAVALRLEKTYDRFHGRQRARVLLDGTPKGIWYEPREDRAARWGRSAFGFPVHPTEAGRTVELSIDPPAGVPLWSVGRVDVYALIPFGMR